MESDQTMVTAGASTAENQVLSLAFIGGIIDQAREFTAQRDLLPGPDSSVFPMVMDAAFGNLDPIYRSNVARRIPELANQVIILVNKSQWQDEVAKNTAARIGKHYIISYQGPREDITEDSIEIAGISYPLVKYRPEEETSEIVEVRLHG
jgi:DNA sulfur modification protein DndD